MILCEEHDASDVSQLYVYSESTYVYGTNNARAVSEVRWLLLVMKCME
jgi:hypothetical protein